MDLINCMFHGRANDFFFFLNTVFHLLTWELLSFDKYLAILNKFCVKSSNKYEHIKKKKWSIFGRLNVDSIISIDNRFVKKENSSPSSNIEYFSNN